MMTEPTKSATVRFNVGGQIYEVSRSLLDRYPDTMLARLASDIWSKGTVDCEANTNDHGITKQYNGGDKNDDGVYLLGDAGTKSKSKATAASVEPFFIERDPERFRYCLDYMRDGGIATLPTTIPKDALLRDLVYYGFEDIDTSNITFFGLLPMLEECHKHIDVLVKGLDDEIGASQYYTLGKYCLSEYSKDRQLRFYFTTNPYYGTVQTLVDDEGNQKVFDKILGKIGLKFVDARDAGSGYSLQLEYL